MDRHENPNERHCVFCGRGENEVSLLLQGMDASICSDCVKLCHDYVANLEKQMAPEPAKIEDLLKPKEIHAYLDQYVIGQDRAKKLLSVAAKSIARLLKVPFTIVDATVLSEA